MRNAVILLGWFSQNIIQCSTKLRENSRTVWLAFFFFWVVWLNNEFYHYTCQLRLHTVKEMLVELDASEGRWVPGFPVHGEKLSIIIIIFYHTSFFFLSLSLEVRWPISRFISFLWKNSKWNCLKPCSEKSLCIYQRCFWFKIERSESSNLASQVRPFNSPQCFVHRLQVRE